MKLDSNPLINSEAATEPLLDVVESVTANLNPVGASLEGESVLADNAKEADCPSKDKTPWGIFATTFVTIFLAEIGDKTQLSTLLMSAESHAPWLVFVGSATALIATSLLGVIVGSWMAKKVSPRTVNRAAGLMLLFISLMLMWDLQF